MPQDKLPGAVVVPTLSAVDRSILATERPDGVDPSDVGVKLASRPSFPMVVLEYRMGYVVLLGALCVVFNTAWCLCFLNPWVVFSVTAMDPQSSQLASYKDMLTFFRTILPPVLSAGVGYVLTLMVVDDEVSSPNGHLKRWAFNKFVAVSFCLPIAGVIIQQQPREVVPQIAPRDLGKHTSLLMKPGINRGHSAALRTPLNESVRTNTTDTLLRRLILPQHNRLRDCDISEGQKGNAYTSVAYEFMASDWQETLLSRGVDPIDSFSITSASTRTNLTITEAALFESLFTRAVYLYADAVETQDAEFGGTHAAQLAQLKLDAIAHFNTSVITNTTASTAAGRHVSDYVSDYFANTPAWSTLLRANVSDIRVDYATFQLAKGISFVSVTLDVPLENTIWHRELAEVNGALVEQSTVWPGSGDVVYEIDVANECGPVTCGIQNRGLTPDPKVVAYAVCPVTGEDCSRYSDSKSMWLFGFGRRIEGEAFELLDSPTASPLRKAVVRNPREYHRVTMGFFSFQLEFLDETFNAACLDTEENCEGVSLELDTADPFNFGGGWGIDANGFLYQKLAQQYLVVGRANTPMHEFGSAFDLPKNLARGRPLVTRYTTGARVEYEMLRPENFDSYNWTTSLEGYACSGKMERCIIESELNHIYMEHPLQVTYTAGLFFLFHNARLINKLPEIEGESLEFLGNDWRIGYGLTVPFWQIVVGFVEGCVMVAFCTYMLIRYNKQIAVWSIDQLQQPGKLVRAFADSALFPSWLVKLNLFAAQGSQPVELHKLSVKMIEFESSGKETVSFREPLQPNNETFGDFLRRMKAAPTAAVKAQ